MTHEARLAPDALGPTVCVGEILVEIVATTVGEGFLEPVELVGPYPSGAPAIFIDQCARLGGSAAMVGAGMTPADFAGLVGRLAAEERCPPDLIVLGGDHLGPNPWRSLPADAAMAEAERLVEAYVTADFCKLHLDASMGCAGEPAALDHATTAERAAHLTAAAERAARAAGGDMPIYVIGTEVPPPGGADHALDALAPTGPEAALRTVAVHRDVFERAGLANALGRVIGLVVQPGVEFGNRNVIPYDRGAAWALLSVLDDEPTLVFEAHSTDYQGEGLLSELVADGFAILKVGPELTFAARSPLRARPRRVRPRPRLRRPAACARDGGSDARPAPALEPPLQRRSRRGAPPAPLLTVGPHPLLLARARGPGRRRPAAGGAPGQAGPPLPLLWQHVPSAACFADAPLDPEEVLTARVAQNLAAYHRACAAWS